MLDRIKPQTKNGTLAILLFISMPVFIFIGGNLSRTLYEGVAAGNSIGEDIATRPLLALSMLIGLVSGLSAFILSIFAYGKNKERSPLIYFPIIFGGLLVIFILGEFLFPH